MSDRRADALGTQYTVICNNNSGRSGHACIYQQQPDPASPDVFSTTWLVLPVADQAHARLQWQLDYSFVWAQTGTPAPGVQFSASQQKGANLLTGSEVNFLQDDIGAFTFDEPTAGNRPGVLVINEGDFMRPPPEQEVSIGIGIYGLGMPGRPVFVQEAQPNVTATFTPKPRYFIAFGNYTQGEVIDVTQMTLPRELTFDTGTFALTATLDGQNHWTVEPITNANAKFRMARKTT